MREIVLDTETTGLDPLRGDRLVEIGCVEIFNRMPTGQTYHVYINPERDMPAEAFAVHGLSTEFLASKPLFNEVVDEFLAFIGDTPLVIHNASFDISFINAELDRIKRKAILRRTSWSIRCCWHGASIPACRTGSTISARVIRSTIPAAPSTAPCSTPNCWPRSIST
ncbi:DNA polymerase III epsilon subunit [Bradyrhizobium elkanii]